MSALNVINEFVKELKSWPYVTNLTFIFVGASFEEGFDGMI